MKRFFISIISTILAITFAVVVRLGVTTFVEKTFEAGSVKKLTGTYMTADMIPADSAKDILVNNDFYPEEIAFADLDSLYAPKYVEFHSDKTYTFYYDADSYRNNVETFLRQVFDRMYENRTALAGLYNADFASMSKSDFQAYYAALYNENSFDDLMSTISNGCWDYEAVANDVEVGTFSIQNNKIICTILGSTVKEHIIYSLSGNTLKLTYSNAVEEYTRIA